MISSAKVKKKIILFENTFPDKKHIETKLSFLSPHPFGVFFPKDFCSDCYVVCIFGLQFLFGAWRYNRTLRNLQ